MSPALGSSHTVTPCTSNVAASRPPPGPGASDSASASADWKWWELQRVGHRPRAGSLGSSARAGPATPAVAMSGPSPAGQADANAAWPAWTHALHHEPSNALTPKA